MFSICPTDEFFTVEKIGTCVRWHKAPVYFMLTRRGDAMEIHVGAKGRRGRIGLRDASKSIIKWIPKIFQWCKMIIATVTARSVYNLCSKVGFKDLGQANFERGLANIMVITWAS